MYIHIYENISSKAQSQTLTYANQTQFLDWRLLRFGKELFIYICTNNTGHSKKMVYRFCDMKTKSEALPDNSTLPNNSRNHSK